MGGALRPEPRLCNRTVFRFRAEQSQASLTTSSAITLSGVCLKQLFDLHSLPVLTHSAFRFDLLSHVGFDHVGIAYLSNLTILFNEDHISALVAAIGIAAGMPGSLRDAGGITDPAGHLLGWVVLGIKQDQRSKDERKQHGAPFHLS